METSDWGYQTVGSAWQNYQRPLAVLEICVEPQLDSRTVPYHATSLASLPLRKWAGKMARGPKGTLHGSEVQYNWKFAVRKNVPIVRRRRPADRGNAGGRTGGSGGAERRGAKMFALLCPRQAVSKKSETPKLQSHQILHRSYNLLLK